MGNPSKEKKLIRAPDDLVSKLDEASARQGKSFYRYVSEIFEQAVRSNQMKRDLKEIIDRYEILEVNREAGATLVPRDFLDRLIDRVYGRDSDELQRIWYQTGRWYGIYLKDKTNETVEALTRLLGDGLWGVDEVELKNVKNAIEIRCVSNMLSQERTVLLQKFIEGAMYSMGYRSEEERIFRGIIFMRFAPSTEP